MAGTFTADVSAWVRKSKKRMLVVIQQSAQDVIELAQKPVGAGGNMPVDTGYLRASLTTTLNTPGASYPAKARFEPNSYSAEVGAAEAQYTLTINRMKLGDTIYAVYLANYAYFQEYGSQGRTGRAFVRLAAQQWRSIVAKNVRLAENIK
jgi:hypothetical protein